MDLTLYSLSEYCALLEQSGLLAAPLPAELEPGRTVELVSCDSKEVVPGALFLCKGAHFKPEYLAEAARRGAFAYVSETAYPQVELPCILVTEIRRAMALLAVNYYNDPAGKLKVIGITGTKGKSTAAYYLKSILDGWLAPAGGSCGLISSIETWDGAERFPSRMTTPEPLELQRHLANALAAGMEYVVMEASSQALKYHRTLGVRFAAAVFLNIGLDHISPAEHPDFADYLRSKLRIFSQAEVSFVNLDSDRAGEILSAARRNCPKVITFSRRDPSADVFAESIRKEGNAIAFRVDGRELRLTMPGLFNVENALAAAAVCRELGVPAVCVATGLERARVPGRMEIYSSADGNVAAIVDFAHNKMSFEALFRSVREEYPGRRVVTVFGCPGGKALDRRQEMGAVAGRWSDAVLLTEDDPGEEDPAAICAEIAVHVRAQNCPYRVELNRGEAIRQAILGCDSPSVVVIAGKGVERYQKRGLEYVDTPLDADYALAFLREYDARRRAGESAGPEPLGKIG